MRKRYKILSETVLERTESREEIITHLKAEFKRQKELG